MNVKRAADHELVMAHIAAPKPLSERKQRKHLEVALEKMVKMIIAWREGGECFAKGYGHKCGDTLEWNHLIGQAESPWLRYSLSNVFWGCNTVNFMTHNKDLTHVSWFTWKFGSRALTMLVEEKKLHVGQKPSLADMAETLTDYERLWDLRPRLHDTQTLVAMGYYGEIVSVAHQLERTEK